MVNKIPVCSILNGLLTSGTIVADAQKLEKDTAMPVLNLLDLSTEAQSLDSYWAEERRKKLQENIERNLARNPAKASSTEIPIGSLGAKPLKPFSVGLASLVARYLSLNLVKTKRVTMSNWEAVPLAQTQQQCKL